MHTCRDTCNNYENLGVLNCSFCKKVYRHLASYERDSYGWHGTQGKLLLNFSVLWTSSDFVAVMPTFA